MLRRCHIIYSIYLVPHQQTIQHDTNSFRLHVLRNLSKTKKGSLPAQQQALLEAKLKPSFDVLMVGDVTDTNVEESNVDILSLNVVNWQLAHS